MKTTEQYEREFDQHVESIVARAVALRFELIKAGDDPTPGGGEYLVILDEEEWMPCGHPRALRHAVEHMPMHPSICGDWTRIYLNSCGQVVVDLFTGYRDNEEAFAGQLEQTLGDLGFIVA